MYFIKVINTITIRRIYEFLMSTKRVGRLSVTKKKRTHGFRARMTKKSGVKVLKSRRAKGRIALTA